MTARSRGFFLKDIWILRVSSIQQIVYLTTGVVMTLSVLLLFLFFSFLFFWVLTLRGCVYGMHTPPIFRTSLQTLRAGRPHWKDYSAKFGKTVVTRLKKRRPCRKMVFRARSKPIRNTFKCPRELLSKSGENNLQALSTYPSAPSTYTALPKHCVNMLSPIRTAISATLKPQRERPGTHCEYRVNARAEQASSWNQYKGQGSTCT